MSGDSTSDTGVVFVELLFSLIVINTLFFGTFAVYRSLEKRQEASLFSRELAHHASRACKWDPAKPAAENKSNLQTCTQQLAEKVRQNLRQNSTFLQGQDQVSVALSIYRCQPDATNTCRQNSAPSLLSSVTCVNPPPQTPLLCDPDPHLDLAEHLFSYLRITDRLGTLSYKDAFFDADQIVYIAESVVNTPASGRFLAANAHETTIY